MKSFVKSRIVVALDGVTLRGALDIASRLKNKIWGFKINDLLFEPNSIPKLKKFGRVFADAKLYDIPSTVARSVARLERAGADLITVHASGGVEMMKAALRQAQGTPKHKRTKILGVTVLTSKSSVNKKEFLKLAANIKKAGLDGVVCSAHELKYLRKSKLLKIVPGIRPKWYDKSDDQSRKATPQEALKLGADLLVIGRPIVRSKEPAKAVNKILEEVGI